MNVSGKVRIGDRWVGEGEPCYVVAEIGIKTRTGKLRTPPDVSSWLAVEIERNGFLELPLRLAHSLHIATLPGVHRDPFDRLLVAQAVHEDLPVVTSDVAFTHYPITVIW